MGGSTTGRTSHARADGGTPGVGAPQATRPAWVFDADFYRSVLPQLVAHEGSAKPGSVPVVEMRLADGAVLDVCQITRLEERWMAVSYYRDGTGCEDRDVAFLPYGAVARIQVSLHPAARRALGFNV